MKIYLFDPETGAFHKESEATPSDVPDSWLMPLDSTHLAPPEENREAVRWNGSNWVVTDGANAGTSRLANTGQERFTNTLGIPERK